MSDDRSIAVQTMTSLTGVNVIQVCSRLSSGFYNMTLTMNSTIKVSKRLIAANSKSDCQKQQSSTNPSASAPNKS